jgi:hypothetical protein
MPALGSAARLGQFSNEDANYDKVTALLHLDYAKSGNSTTSCKVLDDSKNNYDVSASPASSATITTSTFKYGIGSLDGVAVPTNLAYNQTTFTKALDIPTGSFAVGTGDFTIEMWLYPAQSSARDQYFFMSCAYGTSLQGYNGSFTKGLRIGMQANTRACRTFNDITLNGGATGLTFTNATWQHFAMCRTSGVMSFFLNGTKSGTTISGSEANSNFLSTSPTRIGGDNQGQAWSGKIDDVRLTVGLARYSATFTAPTRPYAL